MTRLTNALAALTTLSSAQLREKWISLQEATPPRLPAELMRLGLLCLRPVAC